MLFSYGSPLATLPGRNDTYLLLPVLGYSTSTAMVGCTAQDKRHWWKIAQPSIQAAHNLGLDYQSRLFGLHGWYEKRTRQRTVQIGFWQAGNTWISDALITINLFRLQEWDNQRQDNLMFHVGLPFARFTAEEIELSRWLKTMKFSDTVVFWVPDV